MAESSALLPRDSRICPGGYISRMAKRSLWNNHPPSFKLHSAELYIRVCQSNFWHTLIYIYYYCCPVNTDNSLFGGSLYPYKPLIEFQPKEYNISVFKRTRISRITMQNIFFANRIRITRITVRDVFFHVTNRKFLRSIPWFFTIRRVFVKFVCD